MINFDTFRVVEKDFSNIKELGKITKVIKLETIRDSLIGSIGRVIVDPNTHDILVGDFRSGKRVIRFTNKGDFICSYGKIGQGPGEYQKLVDFTLTNTGDVILLSSQKLIKYSRNADFLTEVRTDFLGGYIENIDDNIYVYILRYKRSPVKRTAMLTLDSFFNRIGGISDYDPRLEKLIYKVPNTLARKDNILFFTDLYKYHLNVYETKTKKLTRLEIPNNNSILDKTWNKTRLSMEDEEKIHKNLHRFHDIYSADDRILLFENWIGERIFNAWLLDIKKKEVIKFKRQCLLGEFGGKEQKHLYFDRIVGSYANGIIGAFFNNEEFNIYKKEFPLLKNVQFDIDDNPILVFFEFHKSL